MVGQQVRVCSCVLMAGAMAGAGACLSSSHCTGSCQALSVFPAPREGSSLQHHRGQDCQSPEVSRAVVGDQAGLGWAHIPAQPLTHGAVTDPGGEGDLTLLLPAGSCRHCPSPPVARGIGLAGRADLSCHRYTTDGASVRDLAQTEGTTTALGDMGSWTARTAQTMAQTVGWMDGQTELSSLRGSHSLFLSSWGCAAGGSRDPIRCSPPWAGGSPASTGRWSGDSAAAPGPRACCAG